ncbi:MAG: hypothetical protein GF329_12290 [Candidatus Lokiarchaeota archaeon]|nr:hypothetical protein [Candidatus Lokiarchaeota archaeon]
MNKKLIAVLVALLSFVLIIASLLTVFYMFPDLFENGNGVPDGDTDVISGPTIINHKHTDLSLIPLEWIDQVQEMIKLHYAHTSHGSQLTTGLNRIESDNATFSQIQQLYNLPSEADALCIADGQKGYGGNSDVSYVTPDLYWEGSGGLDRTRDVLDNIEVNVSCWCWCCQLDHYSEAETQSYLDAMMTLEAEYPDVIFIYFTGNAQNTAADGYNRFLRNQQIREHCFNNSKWLFDFADIDCWYDGEQNTYTYNDNNVPVEHTHFNGDEAGHTTYKSCELKGTAFWWILARIAGWEGV